MTELWDIYDGNGNLTGRTQERGDLQTLGDYHLAVPRSMGESRRRGPLGGDEP